MKIVAEKEGDLLIVRPFGQLDSDSSPALEKTLLEALEGGDRKLLIDMSGISYISSRGLRVFLLLAKRAKAADARIAACSLQAFVKEVFELSGFLQLLDVFDSTSQAVDSLGDGSPVRVPMLTLIEEILLLTLDDGGSFLPVPEYSLELAAAGAILMDLALRDKLDADLRVLMVVDRRPTGDDILDPVRQELGRAEEELQLRECLMRLARRESIKASALDRLVERGILRRDEKKLLWVFGSRRYPVIDNREETEAKLRILQILLTDEIPDPKDVVLICLADACSLFPSILSPQELTVARNRIEQVAKMDLIGQKMLQEIRTVQETVNRVGWWGVSSPESEEPNVR